MSSNTNELATAELVDRGLEALKSREYRQALTLWEEVHRRHPEHPRATRLVQELRAWLERRNTVKPRTDRIDDRPQEQPAHREATGDLQRVERRILDLEQRLESTVRRKSELLDEINDLHTHYREREADLQRTADTRIQQLNAEIGELREGEERLRQQQLETTQELVRFERDRDDAQLQANSLRDELEKERRSSEDLRTRIDDLRDEQSALRTELAAFNRDEIDELREIAETVEPLHHELRDAHQTITNLEEANARLQAKLVDAEEHLRTVEATHAAQQAKIVEELENSNKSQFDADTQLHEAQNQLEAALSENEELATSLRKSETLRGQLAKSLESAKSRNSELTEALAGSQERNETLVEQLKAVEQRLAALVPQDEAAAERVKEVSDSFDISGLFEDEDELRAEFARDDLEDEADSELTDTEQSADQDDQSDAVDIEDEADSERTGHEEVGDEVAGRDENLSEEELLDFTQSAFNEDSGDEDLSLDFSNLDDPDDEDLSDLLGSSMNSLLDEDDDFVDLDSPAAHSYTTNDNEDFEFVDPEKNPAYSGEFEALLMSTPDLSAPDEVDPAQLAADRFRSLSDQPDAVVNAVLDASADESELTPMSAFVLSRIHQQVRIGELIDTMGLPASKTISCLEELEERGFIEVEA